MSWLEEAAFFLSGVDDTACDVEAAPATAVLVEASERRKEEEDGG